MKNIIGYKVSMCMVALLCFGSQSSDAKVKLPTIISDGMVLQRERPVKIWGTADSGEQVDVLFLNNKYQTIANENGDWSVTLPSQSHGGPYKMEINDITLQDILIGDVYLCSGQSNMELPVNRVTDMFASEIASYENPLIRHIKVPNVYNFQGPQTDMAKTAWTSATQPGVMNFSALAYFFAQSLYNETQVPIGLINSSWGGTPVESWMSEETISAYPKYLHDKWRYEDDNYIKQIKELEGYNFSRWNGSLYKGDKGLQSTPVWYATDLDDNSWNTVDLFSNQWAGNGLNPIYGSHWFRKTIELPQSWSGKEATLRLGCIVDSDSVYVNGTFVGTTSYQYPPRIYTIPAGILKAGNNNVTVRLISQNGYAHFVKEKPYKIICGNEEVSLEGDWKYKLGSPMPQSPSMTFFNYTPVGLYNAMISPLKNCSFAGVIWYQGESNVSNRNEYSEMLTAMISDWRDTFQDPNLPFYIVELADFLASNDPSRSAWAEMREIQAQTAQQNTNTVLIKNQDLGEWNDIHPLDKKTLGKRVANQVVTDMKHKKINRNENL